MSSPSKLTFFAVALLALSCVWINALRLRIHPRGIEPARMHLGERLMLVGRFSDSLNPGTRNLLLKWASIIERDPARLAILRSTPLATTRILSTLPPGYRVAAQTDRVSDSGLELQLLAGQAQSRLSLCLGLIVALVLIAVGSLLFGERGVSPPTLTVKRFSLAMVVAIFWSWELLGLGITRACQTVLPLTMDGISRRLVVAGISFATTATLALIARRRCGWRPSLSLKFGWVAPGFVLTVLVTTLTEQLVKWSFHAALPLPPLFAYLILHATPSELLQITILACLIAPIFEELVFRGWLLGGFLSHLGPWKATVLSSLFFALAHGDAAHTPEFFASGMVLGWVYLRSGSLWTGIIVHSMWNLWAMCGIIANAGQ